MEVFMHYPKTTKGKQDLQQKITAVHAGAVLNYITKLDCPLEQKRKLVYSIQNTIRNGQET